MNKISEVRLKELVAGMDYKNYKYEKELDQFLVSTNFQIQKKYMVMGHFLLFIHYYTFCFKNSP